MVLLNYKSLIININTYSHNITSSIPYDSLYDTSFSGRKFML